MNFYVCIHLFNHHPDQGTEHFQHPQPSCLIALSYTRVLSSYHVRIHSYHEKFMNVLCFLQVIPKCLAWPLPTGENLFNSVLRR